MLLAVAICVLLPNVNALTASAAEPVTYCLKYVAADDDWRWQVGSQWDDKAEDRALYYLEQEIKDGDIVVVADGDSGKPLNLPVKLSNLTILHGATAVVSASSITDCYVFRDTSCAVSGDVTNAYVYENATCTFNNNVGTLQILNTIQNDQLLHANVTVGGTVNYLIGKDYKQTHYEHYNFAAGTLVIEDGDVETDDDNYSNSGSVPSATPTATQAPASSSADEYDDVPKTGESTLVFWLLGISAICFAGRYTLKKA